MPENYKEKALTILKQNGFRITKPRRQVIELMDQTTVGVSAYEMKDILSKQGEKADIVSIYRTIECLEENKLVHRVLTTGKVMRCKLEENETECAHDCSHEPEVHCHHFLICEQCEQVAEVHCPGMETLAKELEKESGYTINRHYLEFSGLCPHCR